MKIDNVGMTDEPVNSVGMKISQAVDETAASTPRNVTALFAGIGGLELGLAASGHRTTLFCEIDESAQAVLRNRFEGVPLVSDVRDKRKLLLNIDTGSNLLTAGFPCTDLSQAGLTRGFAGKQSGLIVNVLEVLRERPFEEVLIENVPNWRVLHGGSYFRFVLEELERLEYRWAYRIVDALSFGLPQRRQRVFLYACKSGDPRSALFCGNQTPDEPEFSLRKAAHGFYWTEGNRGLGWGENCVPTLKGGSGLGIPSAPAILMPNGDLITPDIRDAERLQGFPPGWTKQGSAADERKRWRLVGNAINVEVAKWLGRTLLQPRHEGDAGIPLTDDAPFPTAAWFDGEQRYRVDLSAWPVRMTRKSLADFLRFEGKPLSLRAAQGFLSRADNSTLNFVDGFLEAIERHIKRMKLSERESQAEKAVSP